MLSRAPQSQELDRKLQQAQKALEKKRLEEEDTQAADVPI